MYHHPLQYIINLCNVSSTFVIYHQPLQCIIKQCNYDNVNMFVMHQCIAIFRDICLLIFTEPLFKEFIRSEDRNKFDTNIL